jgi:predicted kinase
MKKGRIIMICGLPGSGKTTLSKELSKKRKTVRLCPDEWIISLGMSKREVDAKHRPIIEDLQWELAIEIASNGTNVIMENGYWSIKERTEYAKQAKLKGIKTELHFLDIPLEELIRRVEKRNQKLPKFALKVSKEELTHWHHKFEAPNVKELKDNYDKYKIYKD